MHYMQKDLNKRIFSLFLHLQADFSSVNTRLRKTVIFNALEAKNLVSLRKYLVVIAEAFVSRAAFNLQRDRKNRNQLEVT